jgi:hypothetical protein
MSYKKMKVRAGSNKTVYVHRHVWEQTYGVIPKGMQIHHINGNISDNRIENLDLVTPMENMNKSDRWGKGFIHHKRINGRCWEARRRLFGVEVSLGYFGTPCGAYMASMTGYI